MGVAAALPGGDRILSLLAKEEVEDTKFLNAVKRVNKELGSAVPIPEGQTRRPKASDEDLWARAAEAVRFVRANAEVERAKSRDTKKKTDDE